MNLSFIQIPCSSLQRENYLVMQFNMPDLAVVFPGKMFLSGREIPTGTWVVATGDMRKPDFGDFQTHFAGINCQWL